jgi:CelD/BcsL family acetyltransferase involved in cellulose biosynthesis
MLLMAFTVDAAIHEGASEFDLLWGVESYKFLWADDRRVLNRVELFPPRAAGRWNLRIAEAASALRALAHQTGLRY